MHRQLGCGGPEIKGFFSLSLLRTLCAVKIVLLADRDGVPIPAGVIQYLGMCATAVGRMCCEQDQCLLDTR